MTQTDAAGGLLNRLLGEPVFYFFVLGLMLFAVSYWSEEDDSVIHVDRETLIHFIQMQSKSSPELAEARLETMSPEAVADLLKQYTREEALYRQAKLFGFDEEDYVIRRRLVQRVEFLAEGVGIDGLQEPDEAALADFFQATIDRYQIPARITFTHVFFSADRHDDQTLKHLAQQTLTTLMEQGIGFTGAPGFGERFPYQLNYVEREFEEVASHFSAPMAEALFQMEADSARWQGPLESSHGQHLVLLTAKAPARTPGLAEVRSRVQADYNRHQAEIRKAGYIDNLLSEFSVEISPELNSSAE